jgi:hypothetical protein
MMHRRDNSATTVKEPSAADKFIARILMVVLAVFLLSVATITSIFTFNIGVVPGEAEVTGKTIVHDAEDGDSYVVNYKFEVDGKVYDSRGSVERYTYDKLQPGDKLNLKYFGPWPALGSNLDFKGFRFKKS